MRFDLLPFVGVQGVSEDRLSSEQTQPSKRPDTESGPGRAWSRKRSAAGPLVARFFKSDRAAGTFSAKRLRPTQH
jgi:hypothetical protein